MWINSVCGPLPGMLVDLHPDLHPDLDDGITLARPHAAKEGPSVPAHGLGVLYLTVASVLPTPLCPS